MLIKVKDIRALAVESASRGYNSIEEYINKTKYLPNALINIEYKASANSINIEYLLKTSRDGTYVVSNLFTIDDARYYLQDIDYLLDWNAKFLETI